MREKKLGYEQTLKITSVCALKLYTEHINLEREFVEFLNMFLD